MSDAGRMPAPAPARHRPQPAGPGRPADGARRAGRWPSWPSRPRSASVLIRSLIRAQLGAGAAGASPCSASSSAACRRCSPLSPRPGRLRGRRAAAAVAAARRRRVTRCWCSSGCVYVRQAERNEREFVELVERPECRSSPSMLARCVGRHRRHHPHRRLRRAGRPHDVRLLRRLPDRAADVERLGDLRRVPVGGVVPRRGRPGHEVRRRHAVVPGRLRRRLPRSCCCSWPRRCAASAPTRSPTSPRAGSTRWRCAGWPPRFVLLIGWFYLLPQMKGAGRHAVGACSARRTGSAWSSSARVDHRQRRPRRHAGHHVRAGVPVLAEGHGHLAAGHRPADPLPGATTRPDSPARRRRCSPRRTDVDVDVDARFEVDRARSAWSSVDGDASTARPADGAAARSTPGEHDVGRRAPQLDASRPAPPPRTPSGLTASDGAAWSRPFGPIDRRAEPPAVLHLLA